jgi:hypothetical protein
MPVAVPTLDLPGRLDHALDALEARLPAVPAEVLHRQRAAAATVARQATVTVEVLGSAASVLLTSARETATPAVDRALATGEQLTRAARHHAATVTERIRSVVRRTREAGPATGAPTVSTGRRPDETWTKTELVARARELGVPSPTRLDKAALIAALRARS